MKKKKEIKEKCWMKNWKMLFLRHKISSFAIQKSFDTLYVLLSDGRKAEKGTTSVEYRQNLCQNFSPPFPEIPPWDKNHYIGGKKPEANNPPLALPLGLFIFKDVLWFQGLTPGVLSPLAFQGCVFEPNLRKRAWDKDHCSTVGRHPFSSLGEVLGKKSFSCGYSRSYAVCERRGLVTDTCVVHKSTDSIFFLDFLACL